MASRFLSAVLILILGAIGGIQASDDSPPEKMHRDMLCIGCEMTMKVADRVLRHAARDKLDEVIPETLKNVCKPAHFDISEFSKDDLHESCELLIDEHAPLMKAVMISHYDQEKPPSYLDLVQRICLDLTDACHGVSHDGHDHDPLKDNARLQYDRDINDFVVLPGKNLKVAKPVHQVHQEL